MHLYLEPFHSVWKIQRVLQDGTNFEGKVVQDEGPALKIVLGKTKKRDQTSVNQHKDSALEISRGKVSFKKY